MLSPREVGKLALWLDRAQRVLLLTHQFPDGDGTSSVLALRSALLRLGKTVTCAAATPIPITFRFLAGAEAFQTDFLRGDYDLIIACDCGDIRRTGFKERLAVFARHARRLVNIDHHPPNNFQRLANLNLVDPAASATTQLIYELFQNYGWPIDHDIATALLLGLQTDTGGFKHPNTTPAVLEIAADLLGRGACLASISRQMNHRRSVAALRLWGIALARLQCHHQLGIVSSLVTLEDLRRCSADSDAVAGVVNLINMIPTAKVAILFAEQPDGSIKASVRAGSASVDVARLAALFGGGGLKKAGGFSIPGRFEQGTDNWRIVWN